MFTVKTTHHFVISIIIVRHVYIYKKFYDASKIISDILLVILYYPLKKKYKKKKFMNHQNNKIISILSHTIGYFLNFSYI